MLTEFSRSVTAQDSVGIFGENFLFSLCGNFLVVLSYKTYSSYPLCDGSVLLRESTIVNKSHPQKFAI